jgi:hypothetical protein
MFSCKQLTGDRSLVLMLSILKKLVSLFFIPRVEKVRLEDKSSGFLVYSTWIDEQLTLHGSHVLILP